MARFLTGTAIGLVLGGGGARGCAHVGMIQAMHEAGIPIDLIGGTSIGAFMGALWADELNIKGYIDRARDWCKVLFFASHMIFLDHFHRKCNLSGENYWI